MCRLGSHHTRCICGLVSYFALNQCLPFFYFLSVIVLLMCAREANRSVHLIVSVPSAAAFAVLSVCSLPSTPTWHGTQWTSISIPLLASLCTPTKITQASHCPGPGAVCCRRAISAGQSIQMCTFIYNSSCSRKLPSFE